MTRAMAWLFMVGATCFAAGSFPLYFDNVPGLAVALTFFVGSLFFTSAAYLQYRLELPVGAWFGWSPHSLGWTAAVVQLAGTLAFNISTFFAIAPSMDTSTENHLVWGPDVLGSICFLVASAISLAALRRDPDPTRRGWRAGRLNMIGSIAFATAAVGALTLPTTDDYLNIVLVNVGTFIGAICFFLGARLLLPPPQARTMGASAP